MVHVISNGILEVVVSESGAELQSIRYQNKEYLWQGDPVFWGRRAPILFPIVGSLKDKKTYINGQKYFMNQHGFLRDQMFSVCKKSKSSITLVARSNHDTLQAYPFSYEIYIKHAIRTNTVKTSVFVKNTSQTIMPFNIGGHPGFNCPLNEQEKFSDYRIVFEKPESFFSPTVTKEATLDFETPFMRFQKLRVLELNYKLFDVDAIIIQKAVSRRVDLVNKQNKGISFSFPDYTSFAIWSPPKVEAPFVCLEPWNGYADKSNSDYDFLKKDGLIELAPQQSKSFAYSIKILD